MKALKCDRCGNYYTFYERQIMINGKTVRANSVGVDYISESRNVNPNNSDGVEYDLCDNCLNKLIDFLDNVET